jgi:hypothetical protein
MTSVKVLANFVLANFHAADGNADALRLLLEQGRDISRAASGCELFELRSWLVPSTTG